MTAIVEPVVAQHVEDAAILWAQRSFLTGAPHAKLHHLRRFDDRLLAHLDGLAVAGEAADALRAAALDPPAAGAVFVAAVAAIGTHDVPALERLLLFGGAVPELLAGVHGALAWVEKADLRGIATELMSSSHVLARTAALVACAAHRVDPGSLRKWIDTGASPERSRALRLTAELGKREFVSLCASRIAEEDEAPDCRFWAAWSAVLLGDRERALDCLLEIAVGTGPFAAKALSVALLALDVPSGHAFLRNEAHAGSGGRPRIRGAGLAGDPAYIPWLIGRMSDDKLARLAGESFSFITGADLALLDLDRKPPDAVETGPTDDPNDPNVDLDPDDGLPWPDPQKVRAWWEQNGSRFTPGQRYFVGAPPTPAHCLQVLRTGYQRQRIAAALHRCLLEPGTPLFEWRAPAWRQARELAQLAGS